MSKPAMFQQREAEERAEEAKARQTLHDGAEVSPRGRRPSDRERTKGLGLKITDEKMDQLIRLQKLTRWTQTDIIEAALDVFEQEWKAGRVK